MNDYLKNLSDRIKIEIDSITNYNYTDTAVIILRDDVNKLINYARYLQEGGENQCYTP